jgi:hypothetical protein
MLLVTFLTTLLLSPPASGVPKIFFRGGGSTNSVDRVQIEQGSGGGSPLVRGSAKCGNG